MFKTDWKLFIKTHKFHTIPYTHTHTHTSGIYYAKRVSLFEHENIQDGA